MNSTVERTWIDQDIYDYMKLYRDKPADATNLLRKLEESKTAEQDFFFAYETNSYNQLTKVMWVDEFQVELYRQYGHVVMFDATYATDEHSLPLAMLAGFDGEGTSIVFGIIQDSPLLHLHSCLV
jgi:hypothetical protein